MKITITALSEIQRARFYILKKQKKSWNSYIYIKPDIFQKARQFPLRFVLKNPDILCYTIFHEIFEVGIYIQNAWNFALRDVFIYKNPDTLK